jgi:aspartyl protease family protein
MSGFRGVAALFFVTAAFVFFRVEEPVAGLPPGEAAALLGFAGAAMLSAGAIVEGFGRNAAAGLQAIIMGCIAVGALAWAYSSRGEWQSVLDRMIGEVAPGRIVTTETGEVVAAKRLDGSFSLSADINKHAIRMTFDTGASTVVLRAEDAAKIGLKPETLNYAVPVATANGTTLAAMVVLDELAIGTIVEKRVPALVARAGALHANLLGMTFLERLSSYEVRGNRLILRGGANRPG